MAQLEARNCLDDSDYVVTPAEQSAFPLSHGFDKFIWKLAVRRDFRSVNEYINALEEEMLCTALEWMSRAAGNLGRRYLLFGDNQAAVYGATKGSSSKPGLQHLLRRVVAYKVGLDAHLYHAWVPTALNPADADSRFYEKKPRK